MLRRLCTSAAPTATRVAFLGLGNMGIPMAWNLSKSGFDVRIFDPSASACEEAVALGLPAPHASAASAAADADAVVTMLPNSAVCEKLFLGDSGLLASLRPSTLVLDCSTISSGAAQHIATEATAAGVHYLDTPVSGGTAVAKAGNLAFMCGGEEAAFERARPILAGMGPAEKCFHAGPAGSGQVAKACNNMLLAVHMIGTCEALAMGANSGLDPAKLSEILKASSGRNWSLEVYNPMPGVMEGVPASKGYAPGLCVRRDSKACHRMLICMVLALRPQLSAETPTDGPVCGAAPSLTPRAHGLWPQHGGFDGEGPQPGDGGGELERRGLEDGSARARAVHGAPERRERRQGLLEHHAAQCSEKIRSLGENCAGQAVTQTESLWSFTTWRIQFLTLIDHERFFFF